MRLPSWLLWAATAVTIVSAEDTSLSRTKRKAQEKRIVCYYTNWSVYRPGTAKFSPQNINPYLCTHLIYAFGGLTKDNALKPFDKYQDIEQGGYAKFNGLKTYNKNLKTLVAIGGWNEGSARFSPLVADSERRKELVKNTVKFLRQNHFDGLDLDWEYPSFRDGGKPRDRDNYASLVQELREEFDRESQKTGRPRLLLTMAVPAGIEYIDKGYDIPKLNEYLDWMNILSYDYHSAFEPTVNHHAPLYSLEEDDEYNFDVQLNIDHTVQHYIKLGADRNKLVLGIPTYGRSYTLFNPEATDVGAPADGPGEQGEATREKGYLAYYEICDRIKDGGWQVKNPNPEALGPYAFKGNQWVGYDDEEIAKAKAKYVNDNDLGGIMFWSIDNDDFRGKCHGKPYPLIEAAKEALLATSNELVPSRERESSRSSSRTVEVEHTTKTKARKTRPRAKSTTTTTESARTKTTPAYSTTTPVPPTTPDPGSDFVCKDEGFFPHPRDCKKYFWCLDSGPSSLGIVAHQFTCPSGLVFNKISDSCDYARNVICKTKTEAPPTTTTTTTSKTTPSRSGTAAPPRTTTTTTTTTTTEEPEYEEYEDEEEEDPGTIKELLSLIKKLGGVEQLEKQLNLQDSEEKGKIKPSLYNKFISGRPGNKYRGAGVESSTAKYVSLFRNRPAGFQTSESEETKSNTKHEKPQYVTIQRNRSTTKAPKEAEEEIEDEEEVIEEEEEEVKEEAQKSTKSFRRRPTHDASTEKEYVTLRRFRTQKEEATTPRYKSILRTRSTTETPSEESDEVEEEDEKETEPPQKEKKYSSVIRENKRIVSEVDESKVSGRRGPQYERENSTPTHSDERTFVNNVYTTPKYVEIRRGHSTTEAESATDNVNNVNNLTEKQKESDGEEENKDGATTKDFFQRRTDTTTEFVRKRTRYQSKTSAPEQTTPYIVEPVKITRNRGRFRISTSTEAVSFAVSDSPNRFRSRNRVKQTDETTNAKLETSTKSSQNNKRRGGSFIKSSTTESNTQTSTEPVKRYQFPPRQRPKPKPRPPKVRNQKVYDNKTGEYFTVIFPETTDYPSSEELTTLTDERITTELETTFAEPTTVESTTLGYTETDLPITTYQTKKTTKPPKSTAAISTSTETSVVTSITESSFTERHKIMVTKKPVFKTAYDKLREKTTTEKLRESTTERTTPATRQRSRFIISPRTTTPKYEATSRSTPARSYKSRGRSTTPTPETTTEKKFDPKKRRGYKKFAESNSYETSDSIEVESIERTNRFRTRGRSKPQTADDEIFFKRTGEIPRRRGTSRRQNDDLDTQQSGAFYDDDIDLESDQKFLLGATIKQTSGKDFLNADFIFVTVPSIEEEEKKTSILNSSTESVELLKSNRLKIASVKSRNEIANRDRSSSGKSRKISQEEPGSGRSFRGRVKAKDSLSNDLEGAITGTGGDVPVKLKQAIKSRETQQASNYYDYEEEKSKEIEAETKPPEAPSTTTRTSTSFYRRGNQDYLTNLRSRTRSTTQAPTTTERPTRRPVSQNDRRRYRPETRTTSSTTKSDLTDKSKTNSTRGYEFPRRRTRPTTSTTEVASAAGQEDSRVEESKDSKDNPDLPDLADPAVVAIHNLATVSPGPGASSISTTPIRVFSEPPNFTIHVSPVTESSSFSPSLRPVTTPASILSTKQTRPFSSSTIRHYTTPSTQYQTRIPSTSIRFSSITPITEETLSTRSEVVIQPRRQDTTVKQRTTTIPTSPKEQIIQPRKLKPFSKVPKPGVVQKVSRPETQASPEYEYYDDADVVDDPLADVPPSALKVKVHSDGYIECLDRGNFPHPFSCKKFISCAKMENNELLGWEYTCPKHLSFDPVGGICNWSAGLGCQH